MSLPHALQILGLVASLQGAGPCHGRGDAVHVNTSNHTLTLCRAGQPEETLRVALGQGGVGKRREGDAKVPLGEYVLSPARASKDFHLFLHVGYPTRSQQRQGYTGSAVGVHGPPRGFNDPASTRVDWTLGCIALGTDEEIERVAAWVRRFKVTRVVIE